MTETVLWANPYPAYQFDAQAVDLSESVDNFDYIKVTFAASNSNMTDLRSVIFSVNDFKTYLGGADDVNKRDFMCSPAFSKSGGLYSVYIRTFFYKPATNQVYFNQGLYVDTPTTAVTYAKPTVIVGIKIS